MLKNNTKELVITNVPLICSYNACAAAVYLHILLGLSIVNTLPKEDIISDIKAVMDRRSFLKYWDTFVEQGVIAERTGVSMLNPAYAKHSAMKYHIIIQKWSEHNGT